MKSETIAIQQLFQDRRQYRVPFYQRAYVWNKEDQWERLWADIQDKAEARLIGAKPVPHFLGRPSSNPSSGADCSALRRSTSSTDSSA